MRIRGFTVCLALALTSLFCPGLSAAEEDTRPDVVFMGLVMYCESGHARLHFRNPQFKSLGRIFGNTLADAKIWPIAFDWSKRNGVEEDLRAFLSRKDPEASSDAMRNIDHKMDWAGEIRYKGGIRRPIGISGNLVGFQDRSGESWYVELPKEWMEKNESPQSDYRQEH